MFKYLRYIAYAILAFFFWLLVQPVLDRFRDQVQAHFSPNIVSLTIAALLWLLFFWMDHGGPIPLSEIWWSRVFLWRVLDQTRLYHNSYVPVPATFVFRKSLPQTSDD